VRSIDTIPSMNDDYDQLRVFLLAQESEKCLETRSNRFVRQHHLKNVTQNFNYSREKIRLLILWYQNFPSKYSSHRRSRGSIRSEEASASCFIQRL